MPSTEVGDFSLTAPLWSGTAVAQACSDRAVLAALLDVEAALANAWASVGVVNESAAQTVATACDVERFDLRELASAARDGGNPVIPLVSRLRALVREIDPDAARAVHLAATSQDILDTALVLVAARARDSILDDASRVVAASATLADTHRHTIMSSRTLTQHGVPTTFGLKAAGWLHGVDAARRALAALSLPAQWGGAGGTLAASVAVAGPEAAEAAVSAFAEGLGLDAPLLPWQVQRRPMTTLGDALATLSDALGKTAVDVATLSRPEIAELGEPAPPGRGGSSAMPHKHNPVLSVLIHSGARTTSTLAASLHLSAVAVDERPDGAWHAEWEALRALLRITGGMSSAAAELTEGLHVDSARMRENLDADGGLVLSERLMIELAGELGRDEVSRIVADGADGRLESVLADRLGDARRARALLDPEGYLGLSDAFIDRALESSGGGHV